MKEFIIIITQTNSNVTYEFDKIKFKNITPIKNKLIIYDEIQEIKHGLVKYVMFNEEYDDIYRNNIISYDIKFKKKFIDNIKFGKEIGKYRNSSKRIFFKELFGNKIIKKNIYKIYNLENGKGILFIYNDKSILLIQNGSRLCYENVYKGNLISR